MFGSEPVVILGFGVAAVNALAALREKGFKGKVVVVTDAGSEPYSPVLTSYYAGGRIARDQCFAWADQRVANLADKMYVNTRVSSVDVQAHEVILAGGLHVGYSKLLIATGAHVVSPGFPRHCEGVTPLGLRTMGDADRLRDVLASAQCKSVLVAGTSMVGLKVVEACLDRGVRPTMLGRSAHILRNAAHPLVASRLEELLVERGVGLRLSQTVSQVRHVGDSGGCEVVFANGDAERYDALVLAQGVRPNLDFLDEASGIEIDRGIIVDRFMHTSAPDVFAAGDVAQALDLVSGAGVVRGLWINAVRQGRCAGGAIADELAGRTPRQAYVGSIPQNTIHVRDILFASAGSLDEGQGRRLQVLDGPGETCLLVYERRGRCDCLVGFNVIAVSGERNREALSQKIGVYRKEVLSTHLD